jgi:hypothetical protein
MANGKKTQHKDEIVMRMFRVWIHVLVSGAVLACAAKPVDNLVSTEHTNLTVVAELTDGSRLCGTPAQQTLPLATALGAITIPLVRVAQITGTLSQTNLVTLSNGDRLTGSPAWETLHLNTIFGALAIGRTNILQLTVLTATGNLPEHLRRDLILHYVFNKQTTETILDKSAQNCAGTGYDATWGASPIMGGMLHCNGINTRVEFPADTFPTGTAPRTLAAWVCQDTLTGGRFYVFGYGGNPRGSEFRIALNEFTPGQFSLETGAGGWHAATTLQAHCWYHLAISYNGSGTPNFYVNGSEVAIAGTWTSPIIRTMAEGGALGMRRNQEGGGYLKGQIAEVAAWKRALTAEELRTLYRLRPAVDNTGARAEN